jgi:hypothetical protein
MSTLITGRMEAARARSGLRQTVYEHVDPDTKSFLGGLLDRLNDALITQPVGLPRPGAAYVRTLIERCDEYETSMAHWLGGRTSTLHGHSDSQVLFRIVSGTIVEERYVPDGQGNYRYEICLGAVFIGCTV